MGIFSRIAAAIGTALGWRKQSQVVAPGDISATVGIPDRNIFAFWDGSRNRAADPLVIYRSLLSHPRLNVQTDFALADDGDLDAIATVAGAVRDAFGVEAWNDRTAGGLTEAECLDLVRQFLIYCESVKKNGSVPQTSRESLGSMQSGSVPDRGSARLDSGSTCQGPNTDDLSASTGRFAVQSAVPSVPSSSGA